MATHITIAATEQTRKSLQSQFHSHCHACGMPGSGGLDLHFVTDSDGNVATDWFCPGNCQSYEGILHGGVIATLLDSAMVHALFARGIVAHTAELRVRYRRPVRIENSVRVTACTQSHTGPLHLTSATLIQDGVPCATARAKFMAVPSSAALPEGLF
ncbi:PaaI family thioesterase [Termitidicoccus mucosus]